MPESEQILKQLSSALLATADRATRARIIPRLRKSIHKEISEQHRHILDIAPTVHFLPLQPKRGNEKDVQAIAKEAIAWLTKQPGIMGAYLYELAEAAGTGEEAPPRQLLILLCETNEVMQRLRKVEHGAQLQAKLREMCQGVSASDEGEFGMNTMFVGLT
jgi:hypothetical protein